MSQPSLLYQAVEAKLGPTGSLDDFVAQRYAAMSSWRTIAAELTEKTGIKVNHETLRLWFAGRIKRQVTTVVLSSPAGSSAA